MASIGWPARRAPTSSAWLRRRAPARGRRARRRAGTAGPAPSARTRRGARAAARSTRAGAGSASGGTPSVRCSASPVGPGANLTAAVGTHLRWRHARTAPPTCSTAARAVQANAHVPYSHFRGRGRRSAPRRVGSSPAQRRERVVPGGHLRRGVGDRGDGGGRRAGDRRGADGRRRRAPDDALRRLPPADPRVRRARTCPSTPPGPRACAARSRSRSCCRRRSAPTTWREPPRQVADDRRSQRQNLSRLERLKFFECAVATRSGAAPSLDAAHVRSPPPARRPAPCPRPSVSTSVPPTPSSPSSRAATPSSSPTPRARARRRPSSPSPRAARSSSARSPSARPSPTPTARSARSSGTWARAGSPTTSTASSTRPRRSRPAR